MQSRKVLSLTKLKAWTEIPRLFYNTRLQLTFHTQPTSTLSRIKNERCIFIKKRVRSFIEVRHYVGLCYAYICRCICIRLYNTLTFFSLQKRLNNFYFTTKFSINLRKTTYRVVDWCFIHSFTILSTTNISFISIRYSQNHRHRPLEVNRIMVGWIKAWGSTRNEFS